MASSSSLLRHRHPKSQPSITAPPETTKANPVDASSPPIEEGRIGWGIAIIALFVARRFSASSNLIHDCDEVFNYWEPLHYLLYKFGFQTWEYSSEFALRSYLYLMIHALIISPFSWWYGSGPGKVHAFYALRLVLGTLSTISESALVVGTSLRFGRRIAAYTLMLLCFTSGCFNASTSLLPSTFSMYAITLAAAALLFDRPCFSVAVSAIGVLVGWPFSVLAATPLVTYALVTGGFIKVFFAGLVTSVCVMILSLLADYFFYGRWTSSVMNLVIYNVVGGGDSALYGVEGPLFYIRNGFNNFNFALLLALLLPAESLIIRRKGFSLLFVIVSPLYLWLGFMSLLPHKEERFLFPVYPLICVAASAVIESYPELVPKAFRKTDSSFFVMVARMLRPLTLAAILVLSYSRTTALLNGYSAPLQVYRQLPTVDGIHLGKGPTLCVGSEWHRFPSSFFLPSRGYQVCWVDDGFRGLLPFSFNKTAGGTAAAPSYFNKWNRASHKQFLSDEETCSFLVELDLKREGSVLRGSNTTAWKVIAEWPFIDNEKSPPLYRAFFIPMVWQKSNAFGQYRLLKRRDLGGAVL